MRISSRASWIAWAVGMLPMLTGCPTDAPPVAPDAGPPDAAAPDAGPPPDGAVAVGLAFERIAIDDETGALTDLAFLPHGMDEILTTDHGGRVVHHRLAGDSAVLLGAFDVPDVLVDGDCGVHSIALDPDWEANHFVFIAHCGPEGESVITRVVFDGDSYDGVTATATEILNVAEPRGRFRVNHSIGSLGFEPDGTLFTAIGDKAYEPNGQDPTTLPATLIRIVPSRDPATGGYEPAADNPFVDGVGGAPEVYAYGFRYGWRIALDDRGRYWVGDVGEAVAEEINLVDDPGLNFGWFGCEGPCDPPMGGLVDPITHWGHDDEGPYFDEDPETEPTTRRVAWLGEQYVPGTTDRYRGLLTARIPFGDNCLGWVRVIWADDSGELTEDRLLGHRPHITAWRQGPDDWIYATSFGACDAVMVFEPASLWRVVPRYAED